MAQITKRRKLNVDDSPKEQFLALRQIVTLTQQDCREIVALLRNADSSKTCTKSKEVYLDALPCLKELRVPLTEGGHMTVPCMSLVGLLQKKVDSCPLFAESLRRVVARDATRVRLAIYCDDAQGGNVMAAKATMKASLIYAIFLDFPILHLENLWLTLAVVKARDVARCKGGLAAVMTELFCAYKAELENGLAIEITKGDPDLMFVPQITYLADHEGLRASLGCKGASGIKPCLKCFNIVSLGRAEGIPNHLDIASTEHQLFKSMTQSMLNEIARIFSEQPTRKKLEECEKMLGWNWSILRESPLLRESLRGFLDIENISYDAMHHYCSNGIIAQELGAWFSQLKQSNITLDAVRRYVLLGWTVVDEAPSPALLFDEKLWREDSDYRGDASETLAALPLCVSYGEQILRGCCPELHPALNSLRDLQSVVVCLKKVKRKPAARGALLNLQIQHMKSFDLAYPGQQRPKLHYALHLTEQVDQHKLLLDAFTCERKHRAYKKLCANKTLQPGRGTLAKTALLTLTEHSLNQPLSAELLDTTLLGNPERNHIMAAAMNVKGPVWLGIGIAHKSCCYVRHRFATLNKTTAFEILCGLSHGKHFFLLVELLTAVDVSTPGHTCWARPSAADTSTALIQVEDDFNQKIDVALYIRHDTGNRLWLCIDLNLSHGAKKRRAA